jgi:predicted alpha-1,2-mannosidase
VTLMPVTGRFDPAPGHRAMRFDHGRETATPYYYMVRLDAARIDCELTATDRCGYARFTFGGTDTAALLIEPNSDEGKGFVRIVPGRKEIEGYNPVHRIYQGWGEPAGFSGYFVVQCSEQFTSHGTYEGQDLHEGATAIHGRPGIGAFVRFAPGVRKRIVVRIGTSFTSLAGARRNLEYETKGLDFDAAAKRLKDRWNGMLSRVTVEGGSDANKVKFYTALYHAFQLPRTFSDCDGSYPSFGGGDSVCTATDGVYYCDFSLWDTYRALHPLFNLLIPDINASMMRSLLVKAKQGGWLPIFPCWNSYTSAMIGDHAIAVIADAVVKGTVTLTAEDYAYLRKNATELPADGNDYRNGKGVRALDSYMHYGYVPLEDSVKDSFHKGEQVSRTLEYAYDDFAMAQIARAMGRTGDAEYFLRRSQNYRNVFDPARMCVAGRHADGTFTTEFDKTRRMPYITEGTPWQYTWYVPHDVDGLMGLMGGQDAFEKELDAFFAAGQYWHGNEPDQQVPFLYTYTRNPWKTQQIVHRIREDEYSATPGGLCGNDDAGQISAWYVFASLGLYPVCPGTQEYAVTSPAFDRITLRLAHGKTIVIRAEGVSQGKNIIQEGRLNGRTLPAWQVRHADLVKGGTLTYTMGKPVPGVQVGGKK